MRKRHDKKIITKAKRLYKAGVSLRSIAQKTGIKSTSTILFHCSPDYRKDMVKRQQEWRAKNPERWKEICDRATKRRINRLRRLAKTS